MSLHSTLVCQLPIIEHKINRHGGRLWEQQRPLDKPHDDDDDDDGDDDDDESSTTWMPAADQSSSIFR